MKLPWFRDESLAVDARFEDPESSLDRIARATTRLALPRREVIRYDCPHCARTWFIHQAETPGEIYCPWCGKMFRSEFNVIYGVRGLPQPGSENPLTTDGSWKEDFGPRAPK